ncbi:MAG: tetratricopeptide repeat protein [Treponema sp.]|jgi:tetratricopeptide (TPR) repeat protein|nr:tetratricopeptide repeat protein [Treponema sp.]
MEESRIVFLEVPESLRGRIESLPHAAHHHDDGDYPPGSGHEGPPEQGEFSIDPAIPIPVELPPGAGTLDLEALSWEQILSGMIKVAAAGAGLAAASAPGAASAAAGIGLTAGGTVVQPGWIGYYRRFVLAVKPEIRRELTEAAILKAKNGDFDMALEIFSGLEGLFPGSPTALLNRALVLEEKAAARERAGREPEEAETRELRRAWERVLALEPPLANGLFNAGFFHLRQRDFRRARECFSRYILLADDPEKQGEAESIVREIAEKALDDDAFRAAWERIQAGQEEEGLEFIRDFLERYPGVWNGWFVLGWALRRLGRWEDGAAALRKALELRGSGGEAADAPDVRNELAICLMEQGDLPGARKELEAALRADPESVKIISNLGILALKNGDRAGAAGFFRTVLELAPDDPVAKKYVSNT